MIQLSLEAVPIKKKEKRTLITFFLKEKPHPIQNLSSRTDQKFQVLKVPRSCSYKKKERKNKKKKKREKEKRKKERRKERKKRGKERGKGKRERKEKRKSVKK